MIAINSTSATDVNVTSSSGSAGGLIGSIAGTTTVSKSAAALIVSATGGNAGGLIGTASGGTVLACYSGGHAIKSVEQLGASITKNSGAEGDTTVTDFVATHYGDWPAPEIFVVNTQSE